MNVIFLDQFTQMWRKVIKEDSLVSSRDNQNQATEKVKVKVIKEDSLVSASLHRIIKIKPLKETQTLM